MDWRETGRTYTGRQEKSECEDLTTHTETTKDGWCRQNEIRDMLTRG